MVTHVAAHITKPVGANYHSRVKNDPISDGHVVVDDDIRVKHALTSNCDVLTDAHPGPNVTVDAYAAAFAHTYIWANKSS